MPMGVSNHPAPLEDRSAGRTPAAACMISGSSDRSLKKSATGVPPVSNKVSSPAAVVLTTPSIAASNSASSARTMPASPEASYTGIARRRTGCDPATGARASITPKAVRGFALSAARRAACDRIGTGSIPDCSSAPSPPPTRTSPRASTSARRKEPDLSAMNSPNTRSAPARSSSARLSAKFSIAGRCTRNRASETTLEISAISTRRPCSTSTRRT